MAKTASTASAERGGLRESVEKFARGRNELTDRTSEHTVGPAPMQGRLDQKPDESGKRHSQTVPERGAGSDRLRRPRTATSLQARLLAGHLRHSARHPRVRRRCRRPAATELQPTTPRAITGASVSCAGMEIGTPRVSMAVLGVVHEFLINRVFDEDPPITEPSAGKKPIKSLPVPAKPSGEPGQFGMVLDTPTPHRLNREERDGRGHDGRSPCPLRGRLRLLFCPRVRTTGKDGI